VAEAAALLKDTNQVNIYGTNIDLITSAYTKLTNSRAEIGEANYYEGLQQIRDLYYEQIEALSSLDKEMLEYYGNTLTKASEEISKYTDQIDNLTSVLDHYKSVLGVLNKNKDYNTMQKVLDNLVVTAESRMEVSKAEYNMYAAQVAEK
jgi:hypothetical protein